MGFYAGVIGFRRQMLNRVFRMGGDMLFDCDMRTSAGEGGGAVMRVL